MVTYCIRKVLVPGSLQDVIILGIPSCFFQTGIALRGGIT